MEANIAVVKSINTQLRTLQQRMRNVKLCSSALQSFYTLENGTGDGHRADYAADQLREAATSLTEQVREFSVAVERLFDHGA